MAYYEDPSTLGTGILKNVPVCQLYCDNWFDACKDDYTCVGDWLNGFVGANYACPAGTLKTCITLATLLLTVFRKHSYTMSSTFAQQERIRPAKRLDRSMGLVSVILALTTAI